MTEVSTRKGAPASAESLTLPLRPCEPWCSVGDGHPDEMPGDRYCRGADVAVALTLGEPYRSTSGEWFLEHLNVGLRREWDEDRTRVIVHHDNDKGDHTLELTTGEAQRLAQSLLTVIAEAGA